MMSLLSSALGKFAPSPCLSHPASAVGKGLLGTAFFERGWSSSAFRGISRVPAFAGATAQSSNGIGKRLGPDGVCCCSQYYFDVAARQCARRAIVGPILAFLGTGGREHFFLIKKGFPGQSSDISSALRYRPTAGLFPLLQVFKSFPSRGRGRVRVRVKLHGHEAFVTDSLDGVQHIR